MSACPICTGQIPPKAVITCTRCWWLIPTEHRIALAGQHRSGHPMDSKLAKVVAIVRAKHPEIAPPALVT